MALTVEHFHVDAAMRDDGSLLDHSAHRFVGKVGVHLHTAYAESDILIGDINGDCAASVQRLDQQGV